MLRQMKLNPQYIMTFRKNQWEKVSSEDLKPGDICIIQSADSVKPAPLTDTVTDEQYLKEQIPFSNKLPPKFFKTENMSSDSHKSLPCDFILLSGNCVVNEAILTGNMRYLDYISS